MVSLLLQHAVVPLFPSRTDLVTSIIGAVLVSGSNPHADYAVDNVKFPSEYRVEYFYPEYYNERRPEPEGILSALSYGGPYFNVTLTQDDLKGDSNNLQKTKVIVIRTGFSTHTMVRLSLHVD